ncbi:MAG TPA: YqgE/AlgH family protein [Gammaproteobacteria bacterium]|jgi:putative transcriptional regulator|nr:YqgE/AlgH family protein [Gammaproteobacteria bacterium]
MLQTDLTGHFLIAMPALQDNNFSHTVTYICEHNENGTLGITINRPSDFNLSEMLEQLAIQPKNPAIGLRSIFIGGPVHQDRGFVLHTPNGHWESSLHVNDAISVTTSRDILQSIADGNGPDDCVIALGYSGWAPGQLESEISANAWLSCPGNQQILFHTPVQDIWQEAANLLGVDLTLLSNDAGHA